MKLNFEPFYQNHLDHLNAYQMAVNTMYTDLATIAPKKGAAAANEAMSILGQDAFELEHNPETIEKIEEYAKRLPEGSLEKKEVDLRLESIEDTKNVPAEFVREYLQAQMDGYTAWEQAKEQADYELFKPHLKEIVEKNIQMQKYSPRYKEGNVYDLMLDNFEKGMNRKEFDEFFKVIKEDLIPLFHQVSAAKPIDTSFLSQPRSVEEQAEFAKDLMDFLKVDEGRVYLSTTEHPFTNFLSHDDVRITTHYYPDQFLSAVLSTVHEYGHALYALQVDADFAKTTLANNLGCAAHESQSRLLENHIGRSEAFWKAIKPALEKHFPEFKDVTAEELTRMINASKGSLIRTEADELTYSLHILIRYEIEEMMMDGTLDYDKLPEIWADKYEEYLGVRPQNDREGVLQDMHWSDGSIGYFPSYALGSAYAAQLFEAMERDIDVNKALEEGHFEEIAAWLEKNVHHWGASKTMKEIVEEVSGKPFDPHIYTNYLKDKYTKLYNL